MLMATFSSRLLFMVPVMAVGVASCGGAAPSRIESAHTLSLLSDPSLSLPPAPPGALFADGYGPSLREASLDARRGVAEQIKSRLTSRIDARETESTREGSERDVEARVQAEAEFEHAELIEVRGEARVQSGYVVRAYVLRRLVIDAYRKDIGELRDVLSARLPSIESAVQTGDAAVLILRENAPGELVKKIDQKRRIIEHLGDSESVTELETRARVLEAGAVVARRGVRWRFEVRSAQNVEPGLLQAAESVLRQAFERRGCVGSELGTPGESTEVRVIIEVSSRDHHEVGLKWRYLGLAFQVQDARSGVELMRFDGGGDLAKGGGRSFAEADLAAVADLGERLEGRALAVLNRLSCL